MTTLGQERVQICEYARRMVAEGLVVGTSGNISVRVGDLIAVTPSGVDYAELGPEAVPVLDLDGTVVTGDLRPTSELPMHLAIYRAAVDPAGDPITAIVHTHSVFATAVSTLVAEIPPIHYLLAAYGGAVRVAEYATYGTPELAESTLRALRGRRACLLVNHGAVTTGADLTLAYDRARQLEWLCQLWLAARSGGTPRLLTDEELDRAADQLGGYGRALYSQW